jgi:hypothetical protein
MDPLMDRQLDLPAVVVEASGLEDEDVEVHAAAPIPLLLPLLPLGPLLLHQSHLLQPLRLPLQRLLPAPLHELQQTCLRYHDRMQQSPDAMTPET